MTKKQKLELTWIEKENRTVFGDLPAVLAVQSGQKKRATLSDHPIAIARSCNTNQLVNRENQAPMFRNAERAQRAQKTDGIVRVSRSVG